MIQIPIGLFSAIIGFIGSRARVRRVIMAVASEPEYIDAGSKEANVNIVG